MPEAGSRTLVLRDGAATRNVYVQRPGNLEENNTIGLVGRPGGASPVVSLSLADGVHVFVPSGDAFRDVLVPSTARGSDPACPGDGGPCISMTRTCTARGTFGSMVTQRLLATSDGRVWLLFAQSIVDRDYEITARMMGPGCFTSSRVTADRSQYRVVVAEVVGEAVMVRVNVALPQQVYGLDADVAGNALALVVQTAAPVDGDPPGVRYLRLDTTRIAR